MDVTAILKSFALGLVIGVALALTAPADAILADRALNVLACGAVGLVIGAVTEWLTSLLPIRFARTAVYFLVNNLIAVVVSAIVTAALVALAPAGALDGGGLASVVLLVVAIVCAANLGDYLVYRRAQRRLHAVQAALAVTADDEQGPPAR
ncbi:hypothetical protein AB0G04_08570 [Actinoplanes sp. NPDC023801]|uniref:hypothetical protein n=1 Tax=Actinoplanes sp. NPDC023801 TaxID=3154595 RepID=UPI0033EDB500